VIQSTNLIKPDRLIDSQKCF